MTRRRPPLLLGFLLLAACSPPSPTGTDDTETGEAEAAADDTEAAADDTETEAGADEETDTETGADDTETETETGADECEIPPDEDGEGSPQIIVLSNGGDQPIFVVPAADCSDSLFHALTVDGIPAEDDVMETCSTLAENGCDSCDEAGFGHPPIRIDPGASFDLEFDGYLFEIRSFPGTCDFAAACWFGEDCPVGTVVASGAVIAAELMTTSECLGGEACECSPGQSACELPSINCNDQVGALQPRSFEFTHSGGEAPVVEFGP